MITPRPYQRNTVAHVRVRESIKRDVRMCLQSPTGTGKTIDMALLLTDPIPQIVLTPRRILLDQTARVLDAYKIPYGFRAAGRQPNDAAIQLAMIQTEYERSFKTARSELHPCQRVHVDEIHGVKGSIGQAVMTRYHKMGASIIGYTATPVDLGGVVDECHCSITVEKAIEQGYLCAPKVFAVEQPCSKALAGLKRDARGEYLAKDVAKVTKVEHIKGRVIEHYKRLSPDGRAFILFAHSVKASIFWAQYMTGRGIPTAHIDGDNIWVDGKFFKSDTKKRAEVFERTEAGNIKGLSNRYVLREGVDLPCIGHAILTCPVGSRMSFVQMCGRVLRPYADREYAIIQDHSGTVVSHPALDSREPWDWTAPAGMSEKLYLANMRDDTTPEPFICPQCNMMRYYGDTCPHCGFMYKKHARYVEQRDGTLELVEGRCFRPRKTSHQTGDEKKWERAYWAAKKNSPHRTFEQVYTYIAVQNHFRYLRRDLPLMPKDNFNWFMPVGEVERRELIEA